MKQSVKGFILSCICATALTVGFTANSRAGTEVWTDTKASAILIVNRQPGTIILSNGWGNHIVEFPLYDVDAFKKIVTQSEEWSKIAKQNAIANFSKEVWRVNNNPVRFRVFNDDGMLLFPNATPLTLEQAKAFVELLDKQLPELLKRIEIADKLLK